MPFYYRFTRHNIMNLFIRIITDIFIYTYIYISIYLNAPTSMLGHQPTFRQNSIQSNRGIGLKSKF